MDLQVSYDDGQWVVTHADSRTYGVGDTLRVALGDFADSVEEFRDYCADNYDRLAPHLQDIVTRLNQEFPT